jgi:hypothetical protein
LFLPLFTEVRGIGILGSWSTSSLEVRKIIGISRKKDASPENSSGIHRVLILMRACMRIRVCASEKGKPVVRRGRKSLRASYLAGRRPGC